MDNRQNSGDRKSRQLVPAREDRSLRDYDQAQEVLRAYPVEEDEVSILRYLEVILRRKKIIIAFFTIVIITALIGTFLSDPLYKATAKLEISLDNQRIVNFDQVVELESKSQEFYETQYLLLKSNSLASEVTNKLNLSEHPEFAGSNKEPGPVSQIIKGVKNSISGVLNGIKGLVVKSAEDEKPIDHKLSEITKQDRLSNQFVSRISVEPIGKSRLVNISFEAHDKQLAADAVNGLADGFIDWLLDRKVDATKKGRDFLRKQLAQSQVNLESSEEDLNKFAKKNDIVSLDENMNLIYHTFSTLNNALAEAQKVRLEKESLYSHVKNGNIESLPVIINDSYIQGLKAEHATIKSEYSRMSATFKPEYPALKELGAKVASLEAKIGEAERNVAASIESDYKASLKKEETLEAKYAEQKDLALDLNERSVQYNILKREVDSNKSIYESLLQRLKETEVASAITASHIQVVDYASVPLSPFKPNLKLNLLFAGFIGIFGGICFAFFLEYLDNTVRTPEEVRDKLRLPLLGGIYELEKTERDMLPVEKSFLLDPRSHIAEAFRTIRTSIMLSTPGNPPQTILVTSCFPSEGKTTVSINLASSFAQAGNKVLLLEADLRRPRIGDILQSNGNGLSSYLTGNSSLDEVIKESDLPNLSVLSVGALPVNPSELLGSEQMRDLIEKLRDEFEYIIVDGPPSLGFVDAHLVSNIVDGVAVVVRAGSTPRKSIRELIDKLGSIRANFLGIIINGIELNQSGYYYKSYSYYYGGNEEDSKEKDAYLSEHVTEENKNSDFQSPDNLTS
jgi:polysaccharide biosynthesis transport protein